MNNRSWAIIIGYIFLLAQPCISYAGLTHSSCCKADSALKTPLLAATQDILSEKLARRKARQDAIKAEARQAHLEKQKKLDEKFGAAPKITIDTRAIGWIYDGCGGCQLLDPEV